MGAEWHPERIGPRSAVLAGQLVAMGFVCRGKLPTGFPLDDAWIHQVVARNFAAHGVLGFDVSRPGSGATSVLWAALLALDPALLHVAPPLFAALLALACYLGAGQVVHGLARRDRFGPWEGAFLAIAFGCAANFVWFALTGMETMLVTLLTLVTILLYFEDSPRSQVGAGCSYALAFLTRPEMLLLAPVLVPFRLGDGRRNARLIAPGALAALFYFSRNLLRTGELLPGTFAGRRWLALVALRGSTGLDRFESLSGQWFDRLAEYTLGTTSPFALYTVLGVAAFGLYAFLVERRTRISVVFAWAIVAYMTYAALLPSTGHGGRYQPLLPGLLCMAALAGLSRFVEVSRALVPGFRRTWLVTVALALPLAVGMAHALVSFGAANESAVAHETNTEIGIANDVAQLPEHAVIASFDIGAVGYFSGRKIEDLGGLVRPKILPYLEAARVPEWLRKIGADYVVLPLGYHPDFPDAFNFGEILGIFGATGIELERVSERVTAPLPWLDGARATWGSAPRQCLYRIHWIEVMKP